MATKKSKSGKKATTKANVVKTTRAASKGKKAAKTAKKTAPTLFGRIAQRSAQLILDSGVLGEMPKPGRKRAAKTRARKA